MKKISNLLFTIFITFILLNSVDALTLEEKEVSVTKGESKTVQLTEKFTEKVKKIEFNLVYYNNDIIGIFQVNPSYQDKTAGIKHEIFFPNGVNGEIDLGEIQVTVADKPTVQKGNINISNVQATTISGKVLNIENESLQVTINDKKEKNETPPKNLIEKIDSNIIQINLKENIYEYKVTVKNDVEELDLKPIAKYQGTTIDVSSQKLEKNKNNTIIITAKKDDIEEEYKIQVKYQQDIKIDKHQYKQDNSYKKKWSIITIFFGSFFVVGLLFLKKEK